MEINKELIAKAKECKTAQELLNLAEENGIEINEEQANSLFAQLNKTGEISEEELENTAGGKCDVFHPQCPKCKQRNLTLIHKGSVEYNHCKTCGYEWKRISYIIY